MPEIKPVRFAVVLAVATEDHVEPAAVLYCNTYDAAPATVDQFTVAELSVIAEEAKPDGIGQVPLGAAEPIPTAYHAFIT